jgi:hypothetical protein
VYGKLGKKRRHVEIVSQISLRHGLLLSIGITYAATSLFDCFNPFFCLNEPDRFVSSTFSSLVPS